MRALVLASVLFAAPDGPLRLASEDVLVIRIHGRIIEARMEDGTLAGPDVRLRVGERSLRGQVGSAPVSLDLDREHLVGFLGRDAVRLEVTRDGTTALDVEGSLGGNRVALRAGRDGITGRVADCRFELLPHREGYAGSYLCASGLNTMWLELPASLGALPHSAQAAVLVTILGAP